MLKRAGWILLVLFNISFAIMALYFIFKGGVVTPKSSALEYKDFVSILLTGLGVMIAIAALLVAVLAIWTYKNAMELIADTVTRVARERVDATVPKMVDEYLKFRGENAGTGDPDQVATAYSEEGQK